MKSRWVALLRGINVSGHNKVPMAALRALCTRLGFGEVQSYIQSGNLVFDADLTALKIEVTLEAAIAEQFGINISVIVRRGSQWRTTMAGNPFLDACVESPNRVMLCQSKRPPNADAAEVLRARATEGEHIVLVGDAVWIHYANGVADSRLSPALFDRATGSPVTARNWNTVQRITAML
jgi:uncharacterized protein (DUF1697 family)